MHFSSVGLKAFRLPPNMVVSEMLLALASVITITASAKKFIFEGQGQEEEQGVESGRR